MADRFVPLTPRIGAKASLSREEVLDRAFAEECRDALERYGVLLFPQIGFSDEEQVAFSKNLGDVVPQGPVRPDGTQEVVFKITLDPRENPSAEYLKATIAWHIDGLFDDGPPPKATMLSARDSRRRVGRPSSAAPTQPTTICPKGNERTTRRCASCTASRPRIAPPIRTRPRRRMRAGANGSAARARRGASVPRSIRSFGTTSRDEVARSTA
jgi:hypothetical protein